MSWAVANGVGALNATLPASSVEVAFLHPKSCPTSSFNVVTAAGQIISQSDQEIVVVGGGAYTLTC